MRWLNFLFIIFPIFVSQSHAASFDCAKARSPVEKSICSNNELSKLDEELAEVYKSAAKDYPVQNYVKIRQREWVKENSSCSKDKMASCLKSNYEKRISQLKNISDIKIFSNTQKFDYFAGDAVAEIRQSGGKFLINVWGGFRIHRQFSNDAGKPVYFGCDFEGYFTSPSGGKAIGIYGVDFEFKIAGNKVTYPDDRVICEGFGGLPEDLVLIAQ